MIVCDGFVGNTVLKMAEGLYRINKALGGGNVFWDSMNYENVGGTPVLGVNAPSSSATDALLRRRSEA